LVSSVSDGEDVRRDFVTPPAVVDLHGAGGVDGVTLVGVDSDAEETGVGLPESNGQSREEETHGENQFAEVLAMIINVLMGQPIRSFFY